jgi:hypothetical protein
MRAARSLGAHAAPSAGDGAAQTWLVNLDPPDNESAFEHVVRGPSRAVLPELFS